MVGKQATSKLSIYNNLLLFVIRLQMTFNNDIFRQFARSENYSF